MEAEQSKKDGEHPAVFGQKRVKTGVGQSDMTNNILCRYCIQVQPFLARKAPGAPVLTIAQKETAVVHNTKKSDTSGEAKDSF